MKKIKNKFVEAIYEGHNYQSQISQEGKINGN